MKMSKGPEVDCEEGEIVDDEFEAISDSSIILSFNETGKSLSNKEHLPVYSLSSVSEGEEEVEGRKVKMMRKFKKVHEKFRHHRHHHHKWKKRMRDKCFEKCHKRKKWKRLMMRGSSSSSDNGSFDLELDRRLQTQLKAAIRVETEDIQKNSLRSRLRAMTKLDDNTIETEKNDNLKSDNDNKVEDEKANSEVSEEVDNDSELIQLRLEALRTAVLNKLEHRKKRKVQEILQDDEISKANNLETNKENAISDNINVKKPCLDILDINTTPPDEDEDVLRALLLASMSKKITKNVGVKSTELPRVEAAKSNQNVKPNTFFKKLIVPFRQHIPPKIKPIIINIDSDTESEDEKLKASTELVKNAGVPINKINSEIESTVEKFLREQRAKVEAQLKPKSAAFQMSVPQVTIPKPNVAETQNPNESVIEKSSVKLLPKVKQIEYQRLLQKLKNAQKKPRTRRASFKGGEENSLTKKTFRNKMHGSVKPPVINSVVDIKEDARSLHVALKQMQKQQNGRLQIEEKYVVLTPVIRKINEATTERKKYDQEVKRLATELAEAKRKLHDSHRDFSTYVRELLTKKEEIDESPPPPQKKKNGQSKLPFTSTPNKAKLPVDSLEISNVPCTSDTSLPIPNTVTSRISPTIPLPDETLTQKKLEKVRNTINDIKSSIRAAKEKDVLFKLDPEGAKKDSGDLKETVVNGVDKVERNDVDEEINPGDPNDILRIYERHHDFVPHYVSPLDSIKRNNTFDPFVIMCPFDVDGNCRDPECTYKHYSR